MQYQEFLQEARKIGNILRQFLIFAAGMYTFGLVFIRAFYTCFLINVAVSLIPALALVLHVDDIAIPFLQFGKRMFDMANGTEAEQIDFDLSTEPARYNLAMKSVGFGIGSGILMTFGLASVMGGLAAYITQVVIDAFSIPIAQMLGIDLSQEIDDSTSVHDETAGDRHINFDTQTVGSSVSGATMQHLNPNPQPRIIRGVGTGVGTRMQHHASDMSGATMESQQLNPEGRSSRRTSNLSTSISQISRSFFPGW